ncbi:WD repeat-containing protein 53 [Desmophyllum pertusum]|uniref:WD repeat-containing protein 53 n=1 Tax=Desmophyllum pertusum TaxID=174260 RepID=A0A9X0A3L5_9CNID|nr:WD repeat-containing protein 53 [Desmophyllum pertusum]
MWHYRILFVTALRDDPNPARSSHDSKEVNGVCFCVKNPERLYASCGNRIFSYDLRNPSSTVCEFEFNGDEVNQVAIHDKGKFLAACDDSGEIKVIDVESGSLFKSLHSKHDNICSTAQFRPNRPWEIVTGGMDFRVVSWDFSSGRALQELDVQELGGDNHEGAYLVNPPFVHSIHMAENGRMFAAGLGNGTIQLFRFEGKKKFVPDERLRKHSSSATQVHFTRFSPNDVLVSGGDDCRIILWNLSSGACNGTSGTEHSQETKEASSVSVVHDVEHGSKPNWITSSSLTQDIFVADLTNEISVYRVT